MDQFPHRVSAGLWALIRNTSQLHTTTRLSGGVFTPFSGRGRRGEEGKGGNLSSHWIKLQLPVTFLISFSFSFPLNLAKSFLLKP